MQVWQTDLMVYFSGMLGNLAGLAVGGIMGIGEDADKDLPMSMEDLIYERVKEYNYPVCFHFPSGHQLVNLALKLGIKYQFTVNNSFCNLIELQGIPPVPSILSDFSKPSNSVSVIKNSTLAIR